MLHSSRDQPTRQIHFNKHLNCETRCSKKHTTMVKISEAFLHHAWKFNWLEKKPLSTHNGKSLEIIHPGNHNHHGGPDFLNARLRIDGTLWWGNVEIHIHGSDWNKHNHQEDSNYKNVILHVVLHNDTEIFHHTPGDLPILDLSTCLNISIWDAHQKWLNNYRWIPCESVIQQIEPILWHNASDRMLIERMEQRVTSIVASLDSHGGDWSQIAFIELCKAFGFKSNSLPMEMLANSTPYTAIARHRSDPLQVEAMLFGQAGLLSSNSKDEYENRLMKEYAILQQKYNLTPTEATIWNFGKVRPHNNPILRLAQLAGAINKSEHLVSSLLYLDSAALLAWLRSETHPYWETNKHFGQNRSKHMDTTMGIPSAQQLIINVACRLRFAFGKHHNDMRMIDNALSLMHSLTAEQNSITQKWGSAGIPCEHAGDSQALIQLYSVYCTQERCFECPLGISLLQSAHL